MSEDNVKEALLKLTGEDADETLAPYQEMTDLLIRVAPYVAGGDVKKVTVETVDGDRYTVTQGRESMTARVSKKTSKSNAVEIVY